MDVVDTSNVIDQINRYCGPSEIIRVGRQCKIVFDWEKNTPNEGVRMPLEGNLEMVVDQVLISLEWLRPSKRTFVWLQSAAFEYPYLLASLVSADNSTKMKAGEHYTLVFVDIAKNPADMFNIRASQLDETNMLLSAIVLAIANRYFFMILTAGKEDCVFFGDETVVFSSPTFGKLKEASEIVEAFRR